MPKQTVEKFPKVQKASESNEPMTRKEITAALARKKAKQTAANRITKKP